MQKPQSPQDVKRRKVQEGRKIKRGILKVIKYASNTQSCPMSGRAADWSFTNPSRDHF
jgi:hypothetical protein